MPRVGRDLRPILMQPGEVDELKDIYRLMLVTLRDIRSAQPSAPAFSRAGQASITLGLKQLARVLVQAGEACDVESDMARMTPCPGYSLAGAPNVDILCRHCRRLPSQHYEQVVPISQVQQA